MSFMSINSMGRIVKCTALPRRMARHTGIIMLSWNDALFPRASFQLVCL